MKGKPIADELLSNKEAFAEAVESMKKDDSRSQFIRFRILMGPASVLKENVHEPVVDGEEATLQQEAMEEGKRILDLEGQGIMVYDRSSGGESHVRPSELLNSLC